jgi:hypothetical protein
VFGAVELVHHNGYACLKAKRWGDPGQDNRLLPDLYSAVCQNFRGDIMRWEGFQREHENAPAYVQEWLITFVAKHPPASG